MTALNVTFAASSAPYANKTADITAALNQALNAWMSRFDAPQGSVIINVGFATQPAGFVASAAPAVVVSVATTPKQTTYMSGFALEIATGAPLIEVARTGRLNLDPGWFTTYFGNPAANTAEIQRVFQHEIGHMLGIIGFTETTPYVTLPTSTTTVFDSYLRFNGATETFVGPNAVAAYGGAVPMDYASVDHPYVPGAISLMSYLQQAKTIQLLDVAMLRDTGVPILSDTELQEHAVTRLYQAAFGRAPDTAGLVQQTRGLLAGAGLGAVANGFVNSAEFTQRYGASVSTGAFVNALYQNVLHRAGDAAGVQLWTNALASGVSRGDVLVGFSDSPENRNTLNVNPNLSYSATVEAQTRRLYDTAFGRNADPLGFAGWTRALLSGTTLQQEALAFIGSQEFTNRYGGAPSNGALVDALYQNTLHRTADTAGRANWVDQLNRGLSRADLVVAFSESSEHVANIIAQDTATTRTSGYNLLADPSAHLGSIPVLTKLFT